jgi:MFS family permease
VPRFSFTRTVDIARAERLLEPRDDVVDEVLVRDSRFDDSGDSGGPDRRRTFGLRAGPFERYERTVEVFGLAAERGRPRANEGESLEGGGDGQGLAAGPESAGGAPTHVATASEVGLTGGARGELVRVEQTIDFRLPRGAWPFLMNPVFRAALKSSSGRLPWWFPPQRPDARAAGVLGLLATLSLVVGYHGTLLTQTMTFAADEFEAGTAAQGNAFAAVRAGGLIAIVLGAWADRRGRRAILTLSLLTCIGSTVLGALAPSLAVLATTQTVTRGAWAASSVLIAIIAAEEMPAGSRAYALSLLAMTGALGAGVAVWLLPVADIGPEGSASWRVLYVVPLLFVIVVLRFGRRIPESRRYERPHQNVAFAGHYWRLLLLASTSFLFNVFMAPQSQFRNEFLRDERGMGAASVSLFVLVTSTLAGIGIIVGGRLADTRGRRVVGAVGVVVATLFIVLSYGLDGAAMWVSATVSGIFAAALVPTIGVYGPELFPTSLRGRANGIISTIAMGGSVVGLAAAGHLEEGLGSFVRALGVLAVAPLAMAAIIVAWFPETARRELEELNPEDRLGGDRGAPGGPDEGNAAAHESEAEAPGVKRPLGDQARQRSTAERTSQA